MRKIRSPEERSERMRRGETAGVAREESTGAPPSCSVIPEASEVVCNPHATSSELLYP